MARRDTSHSFLSKAPFSKAPRSAASLSLPFKPPLLGPIIFVIGPPGSGKGTLCSRICADFPGRFKHLSVGDYLREKFCTNPSEGVSLLSSLPDLEPECLPPVEIARYVREGRLLPPETIIPLIKAELLPDEDASPSTCWLIDGFPRDLETAIAFEDEVNNPQRSGARRLIPLRRATLIFDDARCKLGAPAGLIQLTCDDALARQRFLARQRAPSDSEEVFERRLAEYKENLERISTHYSDYSELRYRMRVNTNEGYWVRTALDCFKEDCAELIDSTAPREGQ